jgi:hypothetical protein
MGVSTYVPGRKVAFTPADFGKRAYQQARVAAAANWWDPNNAGLCTVAAYRAQNSPGTPWPGGPGAYLATLTNQANPGTFDLVEGNGAVPWGNVTGWQFTAAQSKYFNTAIIPSSQNWSYLVQFSGFVLAGANTRLFGTASGGSGFIVDIQPYWAAGLTFVLYFNGGGISAAPQLIAGNLGMANTAAYRNGVAEGPAIPGWGGPIVHSIYIGCTNNIGVAAGFITANIQALAIYNCALTAPQMLAIATAMNQL